MSQQQTVQVRTIHDRSAEGKETKFTGDKISPPLSLSRPYSGRTQPILERAAHDFRTTLDGGFIRPGWENCTLFTFARMTRPGDRWREMADVLGSGNVHPTHIAVMAVGFTGLVGPYDRLGAPTNSASQALSVLAPIVFDSGSMRFRTAVPMERTVGFPHPAVRDLTLSPTDKGDIIKNEPTRFHSIFEATWAHCAHALGRQLVTVLKRSNGAPHQFPTVCSEAAIRCPVPSVIVEKTDGSGEAVITISDPTLPEFIRDDEQLAAAANEGRIVYDFSAINESTEFRTIGNEALIVPNATHWFVLSGNVRNVVAQIGDYFLHWAV